MSLKDSLKDLLCHRFRHRSDQSDQPELRAKFDHLATNRRSGHHAAPKFGYWGAVFSLSSLLGSLALSGSTFSGSTALAQSTTRPTPPPLHQGETPLSPAEQRIPLRPVQARSIAGLLGLDEQLFGRSGDRRNLLQSIDYSLRYLQSPAAATAYQNYPVAGITRDRVLRSVRRFRQLVTQARSARELATLVDREFMLYQSIGRDGNGDVFFTGYYEPIYRASRTPSATYRYPIYREPADLASWRTPMPTREILEGKDGQGTNSPLRGQEIAWLSDRLEAFLVHIQGSARLQLPDGNVITVGYANHNGYGYTSVGRELAKDGKLPFEGLTLPVMIRYFRQNPQELDNYLPRNTRFIFFRETFGAPATGTLGLPVTPDRSIATDRSLMPPGALALVNTTLPYASADGRVVNRNVSRFVLDQDTGSAMIGPGRADYFMGTGPIAGNRAGVTGSRGRLYYLLLKN
ncbi:MltA domain-containing protein [Limnothrix sp. FACHB-1083]|nr:MltA domain-containing protein [Limnothrix sp. FACHB-1083]MBD2191066.1 MltA domain-containing protein [Limnothrix sp. FACHB-1088]